jgi:hypothetical protein
MKEKIKLHAVGNDKDFSYYVFNKSKKVHGILRGLFLGAFDIDWPLVEERFADNDKEEILKVNIEEKKDFHEKIGGLKMGKSARIDVFYGDKKMFVTINCNSELRREFNRKLEKVAEMPEVKEKK